MNKTILKKMTNNFITILMTLFFLLSIGNMNAQNVRTVGSGGDYPNIKSAFDAINNGTLTGNIILEIIGSTTESPSILYHSGYDQAGGVSNYSSILIYPKSAGLTISGNASSTTTPLIELNGADNVTIDGRINATGDTPSLTIQNSHSNGITLRFINGADNNIIRYLTIKGNRNSSLSGVVTFNSGAGGTNNNIIEFCNITGLGNTESERPNVGIYADGIGSPNNGNIIRYNKIFNISRGAGIDNSYGIYLATNCTNWVIEGNHFFEENDVVFNHTVAARRYIGITISSANGTNIIGNFIGGSAPYCLGNQKMSFTATGTGNNIEFVGIDISSSSNITVENNTIANISITNSRKVASDPFIAIGIFNGINVNNLNNSTINRNTIGSVNENNSIIIEATHPTQNLHALSAGIIIRINSSNTQNSIENNKIGGFTTNHNDPNRAHHFVGITTYGGGTNHINNSFTIKGNTIGSTTLENSIHCLNNVNSTGTQEAVGIRITRHGNWTISENKIMNLTSNGSRSQALGISIEGYSSPNYTDGTINIQDNTIAYLKSYGAFTSFGTSPVCGIMYGNNFGIGNGNATISGNTIHNLEALAIGDVLNNVIGIYAPGSEGAATTGGTANIYNNFISDLKIAEGNTNSLAVIAGIIIPNNRPTTNTKTIYNNVISLGNDMNKSRHIYGIFETSAFGSGYAHNLNVYFNTVYIAGTPNAYSQDSYCLRINSGDNFGNPTRNIRNNILVNTRSNTGGASGKHYAIHFTNTTNVTIDYNNYFVDGIGGTLAFWGTDQNTLATLQAANFQDANSLNIAPNFTNATGINATDFKPINPTSPLNGIQIVGFDKDFSNIDRLNPPQMGAFEKTELSDLFTVVTNANPANAGNTNGGGTYTAGAQVTVNAQANEGFVFVNWTEDNQIVSTESAYTFQIQSDRNLQANFENLINQYTVITNANPANAGNTNGDGTYTAGAQVTVNAQANEGFVFVNWTENNQIVSTESAYTFQIQSDRNLQANFSSTVHLHENDYKTLVYPNPTNDIICAKTQNEMGCTSIYIIDILGRIVVEKEIFVDGMTVCTELQDLKDGVYIIVIQTNYSKYIQKFILSNERYKRQ